MAYLYTAQPLEGRAVQHPEFVKREIKMNIAQLESISLVGIPETVQRAYNGYLSNIPAFIYATSIKQRVPCHKAYFNIAMSSKDIIKFRMPPIAVSSADPIKKDEERQIFRQQLPGDVTVGKYINRDIFIMSNLSIDQTSKIPLTKCDMNTPSPPEATNLAGLPSLMTTLKIITAFLATHTYPAFSSPPEHEVQTNYFNDIVWKKSENFTLTKKVTRGEVENLIVDKKEVWENLADPSLHADLEEYFGDEPKYSHNGDHAVFTAKPSPFYPELNYGSPQDIPFLPGYVLPHFDALHEPSLLTIKNIMRRFFFKNLTSASESESTFREWCRGVRLWYKTDIGRWIAHILLCLQAALEAQGRLYVVVRNGVYLGSAILGYRLHVLYEKEKKALETPESVRSLAIGLDIHTKSVSDIQEILSRLAIVDKSTMMDDGCTLKCMRDVYYEVNRRQKAEDSELEELTSAIGRLTFKEKFWPMAIDKLTEALRLMFVDTTESLTDLPMHIVPQTVYNTSRFNQVLSVFGPMSPSFLDNGGTWMSIPRGPEAPDPLSERDGEGNRPLDFILVTGKRLDVAVADMNKVVKQRAVKQNQNERSSGYRTLKFTNEARNRLWAALKLIPVEDSDKGKKRGQDMDVDGDDSGKVSKKQKVDRVPESFDIFQM